MADEEDKVCESKGKKFFATRKRKGIVIAVVGIIMIIIFIVKFTRPVNIKGKGITKLTVAINYTEADNGNPVLYYENEDPAVPLWWSYEEEGEIYEIKGNAEITNSVDIAAVLEILNSIWVYYPIRPTGMIYNPNITVTMYDKTDHVVQKIKIFENVLHMDNGKEYVINGSQYKKIKKICKRYGGIIYKR